MKISLLFLSLLSITPLTWAQNATAPRSETILASDPAACTPGLRYYNSTFNQERLCIATNTWSSAGAVTSVGLSMPAWLTVANSPVTASATLTVTPTTAQTSHQVIGTCGSATTFTPCALVAADIPTLNQSTTGNAATATALAANGTNCSSGQPALGVDASGNAEGCAALTAAQVTNAASTNATNTFTGRQNANGAASTAPLKSGLTASIPATCIVGDLYFATDATAGQNIYECASTNTWTQQLNSGGGGGTTTWYNNGVSQGTASAWNFVPGTGITGTFSISGGIAVFSPAVAFSTVLSIAALQSGTPLYCADSTGTTSYTCTLATTGSAALLTYKAGQQFLLNPSATCATSCTLNIDTVGPKSIKKKDCATDPGGVLVLNQPQDIWFNGVNFCLINN
jgi:hypothetical protein